MKSNKLQVIVFMVIVLCAVLLLAACQSKGSGDDGDPADANPPDTSTSALPSAPPPSWTTGEITMDNLWGNSKYLNRAAELYEERTGTKVNIKDTGYDYELIEVDYIDEFGEKAKTWVVADHYPETSHYTERVTTELMTGSGSDIYCVSYLDYEHLGKNGLLVDMGGWLEDEAQFSDDDYFRDILLSGKTREGVFAVPFDFVFLRMFATSSDEPLYENRRELWDERMTWEGLMDKIVEDGYTRDLAYGRFEIVVFMYRFSAMASQFIDESGNTEGLNSQEMIRLLEECKEWRDMGLLADSRDLATIATQYSYMEGVIFGNNLNPYMFCYLPEEYVQASYSIAGGFFSGFFAPMPYDGEPVHNNGIDRYPETAKMQLYGVNAASPNAEIAQDFLRFLLSHEMQDAMDNPGKITLGGQPEHLFPLNRAVFRGGIERDLTALQEYMQDRGIDAEDLDIPALVDEAEGTVDQVAYIVLEKPYYRTIIYPVAKEFFYGQISAEEAARQMSSKVNLYLKEIG